MRSVVVWVKLWALAKDDNVEPCLSVISLTLLSYFMNKNFNKLTKKFIFPVD